ncbi:MAG: restriction endonuclease subunit S [Anaerolineales bacterium]|nr:restriction endonuclease subunit S [Anaerolineales bacterium]
MTTTTLRNKIHIKHGFSFKGEFFASEGDYVVLTPGNFKESGGFKFDVEKAKFYSGKFPREYICAKGDLIVAMTEQAEGLLGCSAIVPEDNRFLHNQRIGLVTVNENEIDKLFLYHVFNTKSVRQQLRRSSSGSKVKHTSPDRIYDVIVNLPPLPTQQKIAAILSSLDAKIELNQRINAELEAMAKTLYDYWFVQFDFPDEEGKPYKSSGGKMVWNEALKREIPEGWNNGTLSDLGTISGGSTPPREIEEYFSNDGTPWITPKDLSLNAGNKFITKGETDVTGKGIKAASLTIMPKGTVLLSSRAPIGYMAIARGEVTTNQGFKSFIPNKGYSIPFIYYTVQQTIPTIINHSSGSTFKEASATVLKSISVCLPPISIADKYKDTVDAIFERQNKLELESQTLTELRDWLLPMLMNGQVKVG